MRHCIECFGRLHSPLLIRYNQVLNAEGAAFHKTEGGRCKLPLFVCDSLRVQSRTVRLACRRSQTKRRRHEPEDPDSGRHGAMTLSEYDVTQPCFKTDTCEAYSALQTMRRSGDACLQARVPVLSFPPPPLFFLFLSLLFHLDLSSLVLFVSLNTHTAVPLSIPCRVQGSTLPLSLIHIS